MRASAMKLLEEGDVRSRHSSLCAATALTSRRVVFCLLGLLLLQVAYHLTAGVDRRPSRPLKPSTATATAEVAGATAAVDLVLPPDYQVALDETEEWCERRYGPSYIENLRRHRHAYCQPELSQSRLDCYGSDTEPTRTDVFCVARSVIFDRNASSFDVDCEARPPSNTLGIASFPTYQGRFSVSDTIHRTMRVGHDADLRTVRTDLDCPASDPGKYTILVTRDGSTNLWHCLMDIFSMYLSVDVLSLAEKARSEQSSVALPRIAVSQVIIVDKDARGPYWDLWDLFSEKPTQFLADMGSAPELECLDNVVIPLPGGSNPLWQGDWEARPCDQSPLLDVFRHRILHHFGVHPQREPKANVTLTFVARRKSRRLLQEDHLLSLLRSRYPDVIVQAVDFAAIPLAEQLQVIRNTDVLAGVHGAGLSHAIFLPAASSVVEILPPSLGHKGFRNLAKLLGHRYFSDHGNALPVQAGGEDVPQDWHQADVCLDEKSFATLMDAAIKSAWNRGTRDDDIS